MGKRTEFLYLSEPDCIAAGVLEKLLLERSSL